MPREKTRTRILRSLATAKWPNSWMVIVIPSTTMKASMLTMVKNPRGPTKSLDDALRLT